MRSSLSVMLVATLAGAGVARAEPEHEGYDPERDAAEARREAEPRQDAGDPKREVPDYDGRGNQDADADSWVLWLPRVVLAPFYVANEYVLRRPIGAFVSMAERDRWTDSFVQLFTFGEGGRNLIVPIALFDFGVLPSVGVYYAGDDLFVTGNVLKIHAAGWGTSWINVLAADRYPLDKTQSVQARFEFKRSLDNLFVGIGPDASDAARARYGLERVQGSVRYRRDWTAQSRLEIDAGMRRTTFLEGTCCSDPSLDARLASDEVMAPPGYRETYIAGFGRASLTLDTRRPRPDPGSGGYLHLQGEPSVDVQDGRSWIAYRGVIGGALDLTGHRRTLRLQLALDFVDQLTGGSIPFTEYPMLGGEAMPGFVPGWMTGRSAAAAQLGYSWPVWLELDALARFTLGNAFDEHLGGFALRKLRMSGDFGFSTSTDRNQGFEVLFGLGTETFEQGGDVTSVRVTIGAKRGF